MDHTLFEGLSSIPDGHVVTSTTVLDELFDTGDSESNDALDELLAAMSSVEESESISSVEESESIEESNIDGLSEETEVCMCACVCVYACVCDL